MHRRPLRRAGLVVEPLEPRLVLDGSVTVNLDKDLDQFGDQIVTVQAYGDAADTGFSIFDTGASAVCFSPDDVDTFKEFGNPVPVKTPGGAHADGIGGSVVGDVSAPGTILAAGLHAAEMKFDADGFPLFDINFNPATDASTPGIQTFLGTEAGSPDLVTITGTPILNESTGHPHGLAAYVDMVGEQLDFSDLIPGLVVAMPDLTFVEPETKLAADTGTTDPVRMHVTFFGSDNHANPGDVITESYNPLVPDVAITHGTTTLQHQTFLFDTGAQLSVISTAEAQALGFDLQNPETSITVQGVGGTEDIPGFTLDVLEIPVDGGTLTLKPVPVYVLDIGDGIDGILGMNLWNTASKVLYDPNDPAGSSISMTFFTDPDRGVGDDGSGLGAVLGQLKVPFSDAVKGHQLPGFDPQTGSISGRVFNDYNLNGVQNPGEPGQAGVTVFLDKNANGKLDAGEPTATTDASGTYHFNQLAKGTYVVRQVLPSGMVAPGGVSVTVTVSATRLTNTANFGDVARSPDATSAFVAQLYGELLGRAPDAAGLAGWIKKLQSGTPRRTVAQTFWESAEHRGRQVDTDFQQFLHRTADAAGRAALVKLFLAGATELDVSRVFLTSPEYRASHTTDAAFVAGLYTDVFGRQGDTGGLAAWQKALQSGTTRTQAAQAFLTARESYAHVLDSYYTAFLHRPRDAGSRTWLDLLQFGKASLESVALSFWESTELLNLAKKRLG